MLRFYVLCSVLLVTVLVYAGLPPTTSKISGDSSNVTTFNFQFPNFAGTHSGTTVSVNSVSLSSGATGTLQAAQFPALTGDVTTSAGSLSTSIAATSNATLTTLSGLTTASSLASIGTITTGTWHGSTIGVQYGGSGTTTLGANGVLVGEGTGAMHATAVGTSGQFLQSNGAGLDPTFASVSLSGITGTLAVANGGTGTTTLGAQGVLLGEGTSAVHTAANSAVGTFLGANGPGVDPSFQAVDMSVITGVATVPQGGTGATTLANNRVLIGKGTSAVSTTNSITSGEGVLVQANSGAPAFTTSPYLGNSGTISGQLTFYGAGDVGGATIQAISVGSGQDYNFILPNTVGTSGQFLTSQGGGTTPMTWTTPPGTYYASVYYPGSTANYWSLTSNSVTDFTPTGTIPTPSVIVNSNFGTISKATSNLPGISFSAPRTGVIKVTVTASCLPSNSVTTQTWGLQLFETTTSTAIAAIGGSHVSTTSFIEYPITLVGYLSTTASTTYNFKLQAAASSGTFYIGDESVFATHLTFQMEYIK